MGLSFATPRFGGCTGIPEGVGPARAFDVARYKGQWFEIMRLNHRFERGLTDVTATYALRDDGSVGVLNRDFVLENCRWREFDGRAEFQGSRGYGQSLRNLLPSGRRRLLRLRARSTKLRLAATAKPSRDYLWILARRPCLAADVRQRLIDEARQSTNGPAQCGSLSQVLGQRPGRVEPSRRVDPEMTFFESRAPTLRPYLGREFS